MNISSVKRGTGTLMDGDDDDSDSMPFMLMSSMNLTKSHNTPVTITTTHNDDVPIKSTVTRRTKTTIAAKPAKTNDVNSDGGAIRRKKANIKKNINIQSLIDNQQQQSYDLGDAGGTTTIHAYDTTPSLGGGIPPPPTTTKKKPIKPKVKKITSATDAILTSIYTPTLDEYILNITETLCIASHWQLECNKADGAMSSRNGDHNCSFASRCSPSELFVVKLSDIYNSRQQPQRLQQHKDDKCHNTLVIKWSKLPPLSPIPHPPPPPQQRPFYIRVSRENGRLLDPFHIVVYYRHVNIISLYIHQDSPSSRLTSIVNVGRSSRKKDTISFVVTCVESNTSVTVGAYRCYTTTTTATPNIDDNSDAMANEDQFALEYIHIQYNINELARSLCRLATFSHSFTRSTPLFTRLFPSTTTPPPM